MPEIDAVRLNFSAQTLLLNAPLGAITFGVAMATGWWGVWQIVSGLGLSFYWRSRPAPLLSPQQP